MGKPLSIAGVCAAVALVVLQGSGWCWLGQDIDSQGMVDLSDDADVVVGETLTLTDSADGTPHTITIKDIDELRITVWDATAQKMRTFDMDDSEI